MMMTWKRAYAAAILAWLLCILTAAAGCGSDKVTVDQKIRSVRVEKARVAAISLNEEYAGTVKPLEEVNVASTIGGRVEKVYYDVGQTVNQGAVLFTLKADAQQTTAAEAAVNQAQLNYDYARDYYNRLKGIFDQGGASQQDLDKADTECQSALVELNSAKENLNLVTNNSPGNTRGNLVVTAPISGTVSACNIHEGEMTSAQVAAYTIMKPGDMYVEIGVSDRVIGKISNGQKLQVMIDARDNTKIDGKVDRIDPNVDARTKLYNVRIILPQPEKITAGMIAKVAVPADQKAQALQIPNQAIVVEEGKSVVYTAVKGVVKKKIVRTGIETETVTEITDNLKSGDFVIIEGQHLLQEAEKIKPILSK